MLRVRVSILHWQFPLILRIPRFPMEFSARGLTLAILSLNRPSSSPSISVVLAYLIARSLHILGAPDALPFSQEYFSLNKVVASITIRSPGNRYF